MKRQKLIRSKPGTICASVTGPTKTTKVRTMITIVIPTKVLRSTRSSKKYQNQQMSCRITKRTVIARIVVPNLSAATMSDQEYGWNDGINEEEYSECECDWQTLGSIMATITALTTVTTCSLSLSLLSGQCINLCSNVSSERKNISARFISRINFVVGKVLLISN